MVARSSTALHAKLVQPAGLVVIWARARGSSSSETRAMVAFIFAVVEESKLLGQLRCN